MSVSNLLSLTLVASITELSAAAALGSRSDLPLPLESSVSVIVISVCFISAGVIFFIFLCGGCTGMEVGSEDHPACATNKNQTFDSHVVTDANTRVMYSSHTMAGSNVESDPQTQPLMYSLNPPVPSAPGFTGYQSPPAQQHTDGWGQGFGQSNQQHGGSGNNPHSPGVGAHQPVFGSEPPPPSYSETIRGSDFQRWN